MTKKGVWEPRRPLCISEPLDRPCQAVHASYSLSISVIHSLTRSFTLSVFLAFAE